MNRPELTQYGSAIAELLAEDRVAELGPGHPNEGVRAQLEGLRLQELFPGQQIHSDSMARGCLAGLWLYHDFLEQSHHVSQEISSPAGSYWHGIMHRREPDFGNSKYWFRRVGNFPTFDDLRLSAESIAGASKDPGLRRLVSVSTWDPFGFVDVCAAVIGSGTETEQLCRQIQQREWWLLFDHCYHHATKSH